MDDELTPLLGGDDEHEPLDQAIDHRRAELDEARREAQRAANREIGNNIDDVPKPEIMTVPKMLTRMVYARSTHGYVELPPEGSDRPATMFDLQRFTETFAASKFETDRVRNNGSPIEIPVTRLWRESEDRRTVESVVMAIGHPRFTTDEQGKEAVNLWTPRQRYRPRPGWEQRVAPFVEHIAYLAPGENECDRVLDRLAHIEQRPGELVTSGLLHIAGHHGLGRNWVASVLTRLWRGMVAPSLDFNMLLSTGFNDELAGVVLAIVDEVHVSSEGRAMYNAEARLRDLVTQEWRSINVKYGRKYRERNACRWFLFSNYHDALPLTSEDRRFEVIECRAAPRDTAYYTRLYRMLDDPEFIEGVAWYLLNRDISRFKCGERPPLSAAKLAAIDATTPQLDRDLQDLLAVFQDKENRITVGGALVKVDHVAAADLLSALGVRLDDGARTKHFGKAMNRAGWEKWTVTSRGRMLIDGKYERIWTAPDAVPRDQDGIVEMVKAYRLTAWYFLANAPR